MNRMAHGETKFPYSTLDKLRRTVTRKAGQIKRAANTCSRVVAAAKANQKFGNSIFIEARCRVQGFQMLGLKLIFQVEINNIRAENKYTRKKFWEKVTRRANRQNRNACVSEKVSCLLWPILSHPTRVSSAKNNSECGRYTS